MYVNYIKVSFTFLIYGMILIKLLNIYVKVNEFYILLFYYNYNNLYILINNMTL